MIHHTSLAANRVSPDDMRPLKRGGVYAFYIRNQHDLPVIEVGSDGLIYVGMTEQGLNIRNHFMYKHSGFSTFRRSLGALLKSELHLTPMPRSSGSSQSNTRCYRFPDDQERSLSEWMQTCLLCAQLEVGTDVRACEKYLISTLEPPLNLTGWRNPQAQRLKALRAECAREAELRR